MASLAEFRAQFNAGVRPSLYSVTVPFPAGVAGNDATEKLNFTCKAVQIPGTDSGMVEAWYMGRAVKLAGDRTFSEITFTVVNDNDWKVRTAFERWMNYINGHSENVGATRLSDYSVDFVIDQLDRDGEVIATYNVVGAFPISVSGLDLGYDMVDQLQEFSVTLAIQWWERASAGIV